MNHRRLRGIGPLLAVALIMVAVPAVTVGVTAAPALAVGTYNNSDLADKALTYVGQWGGNACNDAHKPGDSGGQCKAFVNCIVWMVSGHTQNLGGSDYFQPFLTAGGQEITGQGLDGLRKGDIVQIGQGIHTFIIVSRVSGATFRVVDSNHLYNEQVMTYDRFVRLDSNNRAFRMGRLGPTTLTEGMLVSVRETGEVYRIAGGAPIYVSNWDAVGGPQQTTGISQAELDSLSRYPADGTLVSNAAGEVYRFAGGAPIYVSSWGAIGGPQATTRVDAYSLDHTAGSGPLSHVRYYPADGTILRAGAAGAYYRVASGVPLWTALSGGAVVIDPAAISWAGAGGVWNHLKKA
jgi:hypothetical protein